MTSNYNAYRGTRSPEPSWQIVYIHSMEHEVVLGRLTCHVTFVCHTCLPCIQNMLTFSHLNVYVRRSMKPVTCHAQLNYTVNRSKHPFFFPRFNSHTLLDYIVSQPHHHHTLTQNLITLLHQSWPHCRYILTTLSLYTLTIVSRLTWPHRDPYLCPLAPLPWPHCHNTITTLLPPPWPPCYPQLNHRVVSGWSLGLWHFNAVKFSRVNFT